MEKIYIKNTYRYLVDSYLYSIQTTLSQSITQILALFVSFIALLFIIYFLFWLPHTNALNKGIQRTRQLLTMVPLQIVKETRSIRVFIRKYLSEHSVNNYQN